MREHLERRGAERVKETKKYVLTNDCFLKIVRVIHGATTSEELLEGVHKLIGRRIASYHHFTSVGAFDYKGFNRYSSHNLPHEILAYYDTHDQHKAYPGITAVFAKGQFIWLSDLINHPYVVEAGHDALLRRAIELTGDGLCMPLYGPNHREGYMFLTLGKDKCDVSPIMPYQIQGLAQRLHVRYCLMKEKLQKQVKLTNREAEVLELITFGKTNPEIAKVLNISPNTVAGYVKQIYLKLDTNDRVTTAMRAQSIKLIF